MPAIQPNRLPELQQIAERLGKEIARFHDSNAKLSVIGHSLVDTNYPKEPKNENEMAEPSGFVSELRKFAANLGLQNDYLEETVKKLQGII